MVELSIWYGVGAALLLVGAVTFVAFAVFRGDISSPYYSLPPLPAIFGAVSYAVLALIVLGELTVVSSEMVRYAGLFLMLPVVVYYLGLLSGTDAETRVRAVSLAMVVVVAVYFTTVTSGQIRLGLAVLAGAMLLALIWTLVNRLTPEGTESSLFLSLRDLTVAALFAYPLLYVIGPAGVGFLVAADFAFVHLTIDLVLSLGFLALVTARTYELRATTAGAPSLG